MFGGSLVIVEALAHMTPNDTKPMTAIGRQLLYALLNFVPFE
jgi:hypothetical protein